MRFAQTGETPVPPATYRTGTASGCISRRGTPTPAGAESTLQVRVNDLLWHETENIIDLGPRDRGYITRTDDEDQTTLVFGDGKFGARLPTDVDNVKAVYRTGIGKPGNAKAQQISAPVTRPLGVKSVINPLPATGGADREDRDQARHGVEVEPPFDAEASEHRVQEPGLRRAQDGPGNTRHQRREYSHILGW